MSFCIWITSHLALSSEIWTFCSTKTWNKKMPLSTLSINFGIVLANKSSVCKSRSTIKWSSENEDTLNSEHCSQWINKRIDSIKTLCVLTCFLFYSIFILWAEQLEFNLSFWWLYLCASELITNLFLLRIIFCLANIEHAHNSRQLHLDSRTQLQSQTRCRLESKLKLANVTIQLCSLRRPDSPHTPHIHSLFRKFGWFNCKSELNSNFLCALNAKWWKTSWNFYLAGKHSEMRAIL